MNVLSLEQGINQRLLDDNDKELTSIEDIDELEDEPLPIETSYIIPLVSQILK